MSARPAPTYLELPVEELTAETSVEFRQLLARIRCQSGLSLGQVKNRTGICRSQVASLGSTRLSGLPRKPNQVETFVQGCRLAPAQVVVVMQLWTRLHELPARRSRRRRRAEGSTPAERG